VKPAIAPSSSSQGFLHNAEGCKGVSRPWYAWLFPSAASWRQPVGARLPQEAPVHRQMPRCSWLWPGR
jgi:hypothetical protein